MNNDNSDVRNTNSNISGSSGSDRKRTFSAGAKHQEETSSENEDTTKKSLPNETSFELDDDSLRQSPATKRSKSDNSPSSISKLNSNSETNITTSTLNGL